MGEPLNVLYVLSLYERHCYHYSSVIRISYL